MYTYHHLVSGHASSVLSYQLLWTCAILSAVVLSWMQTTCWSSTSAKDRHSYGSTCPCLIWSTQYCFVMRRNNNHLTASNMWWFSVWTHPFGFSLVKAKVKPCFGALNCNFPINFLKYLYIVKAKAFVFCKALRFIFRVEFVGLFKLVVKVKLIYLGPLSPS